MNISVGPKTRHLETLERLGFQVPPFVAIPASQFKTLGDALQEAHQSIQAESYAIRSSALNEDTATQSMAGQFHTELNVRVEDMESAAHRVLKDAKEKLGTLDAFSLIVQAFIECEESGVCFTRDPRGFPEMIVESSQGGAAALVQGELTPTQERISWKEDHYAEFKAVEEAFDFPQDIEWGRREGELYFLQTRPISTLTEADVARIKIMEQALPLPPYHWEKNELTELAPQPCPHTLDLLKAIYGEKGPVHQVYERLGITYQPLDIFKLVEGDLYVDKMLELKTLYPAYAFVKGKPKLQTWKGWWTSTKNAWRLTRPRTASAHDFQKRMIEALEVPLKVLSKDQFLKNYELIFESSLVTGSLFSQLERLHHKSETSLTSLLSGGAALLKLHFPKASVDRSLWKGNTLDLTDDSAFRGHEAPEVKPQKSLVDWWEGLGAIQKAQYVKLLPEALIAQNNRELGRQLVVKWKSALSVECSCSRSGESAYPSPLSSFILEREGSVLLSPGEASGILLPLDEFNGQKNVILLVDELRPNLAQYFPKINGIVCRRGGLLSHLAILARENGLPVLRVDELPRSSIGKEYKISAE